MQLTFRQAEEQLLSLKLDAKASYVLPATLCELAGAAEWDFGDIVSWIDIAPTAGPQPPQPGAAFTENRRSERLWGKPIGFDDYRSRRLS